MRIGFNARTLAAPLIRGWTRYAIQLLRHLPALGAELVLFSDQPLNAEHLSLLTPGSFRVVQSPSMRYLAWEQGWLPFACARERVEIIHAPANYGLPLVSSCQRVLTLHDAIDVAFEPNPRPLTVRERMVRASFWAARHAASRVIAVSAHAKADLVKYFSIAPSKISVIHEASDMHEHTVTDGEAQRLTEELGIAGEFVLYAGGFERRKNVEFLVEAFRRANLEGVSLVLVGAHPPQTLSNKIGQMPEGLIRLTGFLPDATLAALYRRALVFVYPSLYEGFGLQVCEAMSFGCPTVASDATSLPEVLGNGGDTFSPICAESLISLLQRIAHEPGYRQDLVLRAIKRAKAFSWSQTASKTYDVYRSCT